MKADTVKINGQYHKGDRESLSPAASSLPRILEEAELASRLYGYAGHLLRADLSSGQITKE
ncbi:MAG: hypothetical protein ABID84_04820, partial [Chloroflexota bacterium]